MTCLSHLVQRALAFFACIWLLQGCQQNTTQQTTTTNDSTMVQDSTITQDTVALFPPAEKPVEAGKTDSSKIVLLMANGKRMAYAEYPEDSTGYLKKSRKATTNDLDKDGKPEILLSHYTGGAHCCDVNDIFVQREPLLYEQVFSYKGGTEFFANGPIGLNLYEWLGYFHSCFACKVPLPATIRPMVYLRYTGDRFFYYPTQLDLNKKIEKNLASLKARGVPDKPTPGKEGFDDGTRKAFAINLITHHFNNRRSLADTKALFDTYYQHADKEMIWQQLQQEVERISADIKQNIRM